MLVGDAGTRGPDPGPARGGILLRPSKLRVLAPRAGTIERTRVLAILTRSARVPLVVISAPAGYGKSIVASQWVGRDDRLVGWLHLEPGDNDPIRLLSYLAAALYGADGIPPSLARELFHSGGRIDDVILPALAARISGPQPTLLVLDDVHQLENQRCRAIIAYLADHVTGGSQLILVTRVDPALPLARLRLEGRLVEIHATDLALDIGEIQEIAEASGMDIDRRAAALLKHRTEGWPAGVALAADALRSKGHVPDEIAQITGDRREIAEYLIEVALGDLAPDRQRFLMATSVLQWMTGPLCDAMLGQEGSAAILEDLVHSNLFVVPLDEQRERYRYHQLFGELLRTELERRHPASIAVHLSRAAEWHERHGDEPEAFEYARACGDLARAGRVALGCWNRYTNQGRIGTLRLWMDACSDAELVSDPQLALAAAWVYLYHGDRVRATRYLAAASNGDLDGPSADGHSSLRSAVANIRSVLAPEGLHQMLLDGELVRASEGKARSRWLLSGSRAVGVANLLLGDLEEARKALLEGLALTEGRPDQAYLRVLFLGYLALTHQDEGDWRTARRWAKQGRALIDVHGLSNVPASAPTFVAWASVLQHAGALQRAATEVREADRLAPMLRSMPWAVVDMSVRSGHIYLAIGERGRARELADDAAEALAGFPDPGNLTGRLRHLDGLLAAAQDLQLTSTELRLLPYLPTHLSLQEIGDRLLVSRSTIKTHVESVYAKLEVTSRSEAVERLEQLSLVDGPFGSGATLDG